MAALAEGRAHALVSCVHASLQMNRHIGAHTCACACMYVAGLQGDLALAAMARSAADDAEERNRSCVYDDECRSAQAEKQAAMERMQLRHQQVRAFVAAARRCHCKASQLSGKPG